jgi:hypothetical protein
MTSFVELEAIDAVCALNDLLLSSSRHLLRHDGDFFRSVLIEVDREQLPLKVYLR